MFTPAEKENNLSAYGVGIADNKPIAELDDWKWIDPAGTWPSGFEIFEEPHSVRSELNVTTNES